MGKKGGSAGKNAAKAAKKEKQEKLASRKAAKDDKKKQPPQQNGTKGKGKAGKTGKKAPAEEEDLDALLKKFAQEWQEAHATSEETVGGPPTRRANATLTACPLGTDLWLFGGEYFDGDRATFYADLYRYTPPSTLPTQSLSPDDAVTSENDQEAGSSKDATGTWRKYTSPNQPGPRSAHQMVADPRQGGLLYVFGGEFASPKQTSFHHYRDLWIFSIANKSWDRIDTKVRPSARSGHRMCMWRHYLVLFGGFIDTGARTTYLQDLWFFDTSQYKWIEIPQNDLKRPPARSGHSLLPTSEGVLLYGGYCKRYVKGQRTQGVALEDAWFLKIVPQADGSLLPPNTPQGGKIEWDKRRKIGYAPGPRSGCTMALWNNRNMGVLFGGVTDREDDEESMESILFDDLFGYNVGGTGRWVSLNLRKKKQKAAAGGKKKREKAAAAAAAAAAKEAEMRARIREQEEENDFTDDDSESDTDDESERGDRTQSAAQATEEKPQAPNLALSALKLNSNGHNNGHSNGHADGHDPDDPENSKPLTRFNAMLAVQRNTLFLYGGIHETLDREYTLDDFFILQLDKLERWVCLRQCRVEGLEWNESDDEDDDSDDDSDSGSSSDEDEESKYAAEQEGEEVASLHSHNSDEESEELDEVEIEKRRVEREAHKKMAKEALGVARGENSQVSEEDRQSTPLPGESLRVFFDRTRNHWSGKAFELTKGEARGKEMRTRGFELAEQRYEEYKPVMREIEKIQAEAGLDAEELRQTNRTGNAPLSGGVGVESRHRR